MKDNIIKAIKDKKKISFNYKNMGTRIVAPYVLYLNVGDEEILDAFQYRGYSEKGDLPNWRPFFIKNISDLRILDDNFETNEGYNPSSTRYAKAICKLQI